MLLEARSEFSPAGTLFVLALMFLPLLFAWAASVYENRLSVYFSEQVGEPVNIEKKHIILGVIFSYSVPLFAISFGLLGLYQFTGDMGTEVVEGMPIHSTPKLYCSSRSRCWPASRAQWVTSDFSTVGTCWVITRRRECFSFAGWIA
jgi:hypothetical protein